MKPVRLVTLLSYFLVILSTQGQDKPNIIVILVDDLGWSDFGCYGGEIHTPTIDRLAENGLKYRQFYNAARCSPTRAAILTGLYTQQVATEPERPLPNLRTDNNVTIAELLGANGYRTYMSGKWHLGRASTGRDPISRGFQHVFGFANDVAAGNRTSYWDINLYNLVSENNEVAWRDYAGQQFYQTDAIGDYSADFIDHHIAKGDDSPFFLYMAFNAPHWPVEAPAELANRYTDIGDPNPADDDVYLYEQGWDMTRATRYQRQLDEGIIDDRYVLSPKSDAPNSGTYVDIPAWEDVDEQRRDDLTRRMALYAGMVESIDINIEKVISKLESINQLDNTFILICSDNGGNFEGGLYGNPNARETADLAMMGQPDDVDFPRVNLGGGWANVNNTPFKLYKRFAHEGGIRSPGIVHFPQGISSPNRWVEQPTHLIDVMPTVVELANVAYPESFEGHPVLPLEGHSLTSHFQGNEMPPKQIFVEHEDNRALFDGDFKLVTKNFDFLDGSSPANNLELYNLATDPSEINNLAETDTIKLKQMVEDWNAKATEVGVPASRLLTLEPPPVFDKDSIFYFNFDGTLTSVWNSDIILENNTGETGWFHMDDDGIDGKALYLSGQDNTFLSLDQLGLLDPATSDYTVAAWVYNTSDTNLPAEQVILHQNGGRGATRFLLAMFGTTELSVGTFITGSLSTSDITVNRNKWTHVAIVGERETSTLRFYVNGQLINSVTKSSPFESATGGFMIGKHRADNKPNSSFVGYLDEFYLFGKALTGSEIAVLASESDAKVWSAGVWVPEAPLVNDEVIFESNYNTLVDGSLDVGNVTIQGGVVVNVANGTFIETSDLVNSGSLVVESGGSLLTEGSVSNGNYTIVRDTPHSVGKYSIVGSPVSSATRADLGSLVYWYDETVPYNSSIDDPANGNDGLDRFVEIADNSTELGIGQGYFSAFTETLSFSGTPNSGTIEVPVTLTDHDPENDDDENNYEGFFLVSNPYPSAIDPELFIDENVGILGSLYFWDDFGSNSGERGTGADYIIWNRLGIINQSRTGSNDGWDGMIRSGQGFFIKLQTNDPIVFNNDMRVRGDNSNEFFFRRAEYQSLKLAVEGSSSYSEILVGLAPEATTGLDRIYDAQRLGGGELQFYSVSGLSRLVIQGLPAGLDSYHIPLGVKAIEEGNYTIKIVQNQINHHQIFLEDSQLSKSIDLSSGQNYSFDLDNQLTQDRFSLKITTSIALGVQAYNGPNLYVKDRKIQIDFLKDDLPTAIEAQIFDTSGKNLFGESLSLQSSGITEVPYQLKSGFIYIVDLRFDKEVVRKKLFLR